MNRRRMGARLSLLLLFAILCCTLPAGLGAASNPLSIAFTHDMHSHLDAIINVQGDQTAHHGGFAKLSTRVHDVRARYPQTLLVDAGDFSMGTLYQTIFASDAPELRLMGALGYDATTFGNHEFDYRAAGLTNMLHAAIDSGAPLPQLLCANIDWDKTLADPALAIDAAALRNAMDRYGVKPYTIVESGGYRVALFGLLGKEADSYAPLSGLVFRDPIAAAKEVVDAIHAAGAADVIVCLSHSGTENSPQSSEDELLAAAVPQIDVIVSGHTHTVLEQPLIIGDTIIVSGGSYTDYLGHLVIEPGANGRFSVSSYALLPLDGAVAEDEAMRALILGYRERVSQGYLAHFGYAMGEIVAQSPFDFTPIDTFGDDPGEDALGNLIADSYVYAAQRAGVARVDVAVVPAGVVRGTFRAGPIAVDDVFNVSSLGIGADGVPGYPLVAVYLTGKELWALCEVDASVSVLMEDARLYTAGLRYTFNPRRLLLNRVSEVSLERPDGALAAPQDDALYCVVGGLYSTQMLATVEKKSFGLLSLVPKDKDGNPITDFEAHILTHDGAEYKEWAALADYLSSFEKVDGVPVIPARYAAPEGRKTIVTSLNPIALFKRPNKVFFLVAGIAAALLALIALAAALIVRAIKKRRQAREA